MKHNIVVYEATQQEWDEWKKKVSKGSEETKSAASALAITTASALWLGTIFRAFSSKKMTPQDAKVNRQLLTVSTLAASAGVWHFYKIVRKVLSKEEATRLATKFAEDKARISKDKEDIERAKKWKKRSKRL